MNAMQSELLTIGEREAARNALEAANEQARLARQQYTRGVHPRVVALRSGAEGA